MVVTSRRSALADHGAGTQRLRYRLHLGGRGQPIRLTVSDDNRTLGEADLRRRSDLHPLDHAIVRELGNSAVFGYIAESQLARLLPLLQQRQAALGEARLQIAEDELHPRVKVGPGPSGRLQLEWGLADAASNWLDLSKGRVLVGLQAFWLHGTTAYPIASPAPWDLQEWAADPVRSLDRELGALERDRLVAKLARSGVPNDDLRVLGVQRGPPDRIVAHLWAAGDPLRAYVAVQTHYGAAVATVAGQRPTSLYLMDAATGLIERDIAVEDHARRLLRDLHMNFDQEHQAFVAHHERALALLDPHTELLPAHWIIERRQENPAFHRDLTLSAQIKLIEEQGLLDVSVEFGTPDVDDDATVAALIDMQDLLRWLQTGKRYVRLKDGSYVAPSEAFRQRLRVLEDLGAQGQRALVSPLCVGLLRLLGDREAIATADAATAAWLAEVTQEARPASVEPPGAVVKILREYQRHGIDWLAMLHRYRLTGILADDMGLGKTIQTLALLLWAREHEGNKPSLVVAPTSVVTVWRDEAARFTPELRVALWHGDPKVRHGLAVQDHDLIITSYGVIRRDAARMGQHPWRYIILDEAQAAKNAATQNARAIRQLQSERRLALTGTPIENRPEELWAAFDFLAPGFLGSLRQFRKRYARPIGAGDDDALSRLRARVQPLLLRRLKSEVAPELPAKLETTVRCQMEPAQRALYDHLAGTLRARVVQRIETVGIERAQIDILAALTRLRQICCDPALLPAPPGTKTPPSAKLALFEELMREALASERRIVVFSQFVQMQKRLIAVVQRLGVEPLWLHGGTRHRDKVVDAFQTPSGPPVIIVSLRAGGTGLTLTRADTVMHYDPWWNPAVERQATDRTHRLGQTQRVTVYKLICADTIEDKVVAMAAEKSQLAATLLGSEGGHGAKVVTRDEVLALLN